MWRSSSFFSITARIPTRMRIRLQYSPLTEAALSGDPAIVELLLSKGADVKATKDVAIANAVDVGCSKCLRLLTAHPISRDAASLALADIAQIGDLEAVRLLLD